MYKKLSKELNGYNIIEIKPDDNMNFNDIEIEAIGAYNLKSGLIVPHPKSAMNVGYIISFKNIKIYHTGDTDYTASMKQLQNISVVLTPIDGGNLTMTTEKAAEFINHIRPLYVIPMHYNLGSDEINKFKKLINSSTQVIVMDR